MVRWRSSLTLFCLIVGDNRGRAGLVWEGAVGVERGAVDGCKFLGKQVIKRLNFVSATSGQSSGYKSMCV